MGKKYSHVLVGGSGFIGKHLISILEGDKLILDLKEPLSCIDRVDFMKLDIRDSSSFPLEDFLDENTTIHHLAAVHFDFQSDFYETNVNGTKNVIEAFSTCRNWIFYSSVATYGDSYLTRDESSNQVPTNDYGKSKLLMEKIIYDQVTSWSC